MKRGFTLIELLVVIAIISLLSSVVLASLGNSRTKARDSKRIQELGQIRNALAIYYSSNGSYPHVTAGVNSGEPQWDGAGLGLKRNLYLGLVGNNIMSTLPTDPTESGTSPSYNGGSNFNFFYHSVDRDGDGKSEDYDLGVRLELPHDLACGSPGRQWPSHAVDMSGSDFCNFIGAGIYLVLDH